MNSTQVRKAFLDFFESKGHKIVPSAPLVIKNDPTLMFTNAGMNQFKDYFLGNANPTNTRIADTQKCLRVSGKHNDLEEVGIDTYHHTMFEMLGNWSFGDYFKENAIEWAWELLTHVYKLDPARLYVTVFEGDPTENLEKDNEAFNFWKKWIAEDRILMGSKKDNFWEMGDTGPCGPCSEIHVDLRSDDEIAKIDARTLVNNDHPQVIEIWNLVFMEFNRKADGSLEKLPAQHVDTGMGFERLCRAIEGKSSNYDTDVFQPLIQKIAQLSSLKYGENEQIDIAMRVISDHIRAVSFAISDGQLPSSNGAGYVIRRILRRAIRYGYSYLNLKEPFFFELVEVLAKQTEEIFPDLTKQKDFVIKVIKEEEISFLKTLGRGIEIINNLQISNNVIPGDKAFELFDTYGFPKDLTQLLAKEKGWSVDLNGFDEAMEAQKNRSRAATSLTTGDWVLLGEETESEFIGYDHLTANSKIIKYRKVNSKNKDLIQIVLDKTPFYAESGGQVGDTGYLISLNEKIQVINTIKENNLIIHLVDQLPNNPNSLFEAIVDVERRINTTSNHSATHLLHAALRDVLGSHVEQKGSLVSPDYLRFDFSHFSKISDEDLLKIEEIVNQKIRENIPLLEERNVPIKEAMNKGAMALFGEKYGDFVRVITFDPNFSVELCGGTHVKATGEIGFFKIITETAVAAGVRRIEALSALPAQKFIQEQYQLVQDFKNILQQKDLVKALESLKSEQQNLKKKIEDLENLSLLDIKAKLISKKILVNQSEALFEIVNVSTADNLKKLGAMLKNELQNPIIFLVSNIEGKPFMGLWFDENLQKQNSWNAGALVKEYAKIINGGGGGQPFFATAGGTNPEAIPNLLEKVKSDFIK